VTVNIGETWRDQAGIVNQALIRDWLEEQDCNVVIATDGSIRGDVTAWIGAVWRDLGRCFEWSTARDRGGPAVAGQNVRPLWILAWIRWNALDNDRIAILTDSLSLVSTLEKGLLLESWWDVAMTKVKLRVAYIPGHRGISFNERADMLAGEAEAFGELTRTPGYVLLEISTQMGQGEQ
jgi:hypothetical protein